MAKPPQAICWSLKINLIKTSRYIQKSVHKKRPFLGTLYGKGEKNEK